MAWTALLALAGIGTLKDDFSNPKSNIQTKGKFYIEAFAGQSVIAWLGSEDPRKAHGVGFGAFIPGPRRLRYRHYVPDILIEAYYHRSTSPGASGVGPNGTDSFGIVQLVRYHFPLGKGTSGYFDMGMGLQYADMRTVDLSGRLNTTPIIGLGLAFGEGRTQFVLGVRYLHISNAGLQGNNQGQNQILLTAGIRF